MSPKSTEKRRPGKKVGGPAASTARWLDLPEWAHPGVIKVRSQDRQPFERSFNLEAARRYDDPTLVEEWRKEIDSHLKRSHHSHDEGPGSVGIVLSPGILAIDLDNHEGVRWIRSLIADNTPCQQRTEHGAHFYFRYDPDSLFVYSRNGIVFDTKISGAIDKARFDIRCCINKSGARGGTCTVIPPSKREDGFDYTWIVPLPDRIEDIPILPDRLIKILRGLLSQRKTKKREDSRHVRSLRFQRRMVIEAEVDTPEAREEIREATVDFLSEIYAGDESRLAMEMDDLDRQLEGAFNMEDAFQGFQRDGTAESVALEILKLGEGGVAFVTEEKEWRVFDGVCWRGSSEWEVKKIIGDYYREYLADAAISDDDDEVEALTKIAMRLKGVAFVEQVYKRMKANLHVGLAQFDPHIELITFPEDEERGIAAITLNARTGETHEPRMSELITMTMGVPYVPNARHPVVDAWWESSFPDEETRLSVQMHLGMSMIGWIPEERIYFMHGRGASGKGTLANATMLCLGGYGAESDPSTWSGNGSIDGSRNAPDLAGLRGKRFVFIDEIAATRTLGSRAKALSQDGFITAAAKYRDPSTFRITWTPWIAGNTRPKIDSTDRGLVRRIVEIPMNAGSDTPDNPDWHIKDTLKRDPEAQIAWMALLVRGLTSAREHEFRPPISADMKSATRDWLESADMIGDWWVERVEAATGADRIAAGDLLRDYNEWMYENQRNEHRANKMQFSNLLKTRGVQKAKLGSYVWYYGIKLRESAEGVLMTDALPKLPK